MCITSETCRANSVIKTALNNLHQAGPNKTHIYDDAWKHKNQISRPFLGPTIQWATGDLTAEVKWPGRATDHSA